MDTRLQIISIVVSLGLFLLVFELVRQRRLMERYALLWMFSAACLLGLSVWSDLLNQVSDLMGVQYGPSVLFAVALGFGFVLMLHFSLVLSRLSDQNKVLAQRVALLQRRLDAELGDGQSSSLRSEPTAATRPAAAAPTKPTITSR
jgi:hypothetical protein